jgi:hypothetical protein
VSRGGVKLAAALDHFRVDVAGRVCLDVGASTGGFTEVLRGCAAPSASMRSTSAAISCIRALRGRGEDRFPGANRHPHARSVASCRAAGFGRGGRELHLAQAGAAGDRQASPAARAIVALIKPQFEAPRRAIKKGIVRDAAVHARSATTSPRFSPRKAGASAAASPRRSSAATATPSSSSRPSVVERLLIDRLGHRGDGVADGAGGAIYVPGALPGETVEVEAVAGHPDRRRLCSRSRRARSASRRSARISACAAAAPCSIGMPPAIARGSAASWSRRCASRARRPVADLDRRARRRPPPRRIPRPARHTTTCSKSASRPRAPPRGRDRPLPGAGAEPRRRHRGRLGDRRSARSEKAARYPGHRDGCRPRRRRARLRPA